jgi:hypothetical protein
MYQTETLRHVPLKRRVQKKSKFILARDHGGPKGCETSRLPHYLESRHTDGGEVVSLKRRPLLYSQDDSWYSFLSEAESIPGP